MIRSFTFNFLPALVFIFFGSFLSAMEKEPQPKPACTYQSGCYIKAVVESLHLIDPTKLLIIDRDCSVFVWDMAKDTSDQTARLQEVRFDFFPVRKAWILDSNHLVYFLNHSDGTQSIKIAKIDRAKESLGSGYFLQEIHRFHDRDICPAHLDHSITCISFLKDKRYLACGLSDGGLFIFDLKERRRVSELAGKGYGYRISSLIPLDSDSLIAFVQNDSIGIWDFKANAVITQLQGYHEIIPYNKEKVIVVSAGTHEVYVYDIKSATLTKLLNQNNVSEVVVINDTYLITSCFGDNYLYVWDIRYKALIGKILWNTTSSYNSVTHIKVLDESHILIATSAGDIKILTLSPLKSFIVDLLVNQPLYNKDQAIKEGDTPESARLPNLPFELAQMVARYM